MQIWKAAVLQYTDTLFLFCNLLIEILVDEILVDEILVDEIFQLLKEKQIQEYLRKKMFKIVFYVK